MRADIRRSFLWMSAFFIAMAYLESAVVVYLRALYYPQGFSFPLMPMAPPLIATEVWREAATLLMLLAPAALIARSALERFAWFCYGFGIWDLFYYVWLKVLLDWPSSLSTPDLLFLIPVPWVGPVWAPGVISLGLILLALVILRGRSRAADFRIDRRSWALLVAGAVLMVVSFTIDPLLHMGGFEALTSASSIGADGARALLDGRSYEPGAYPWPWLAGGLVLAMAGLYRSGRPWG